MQVNFHDDEDTNTFGIIKKGNFIAKSDFIMEFVLMVEAEENTGYMVDVIREVDNQKR